MTSSASMQPREDGSAAVSDFDVRRSYERLRATGPEASATPELAAEVARHWAEAVAQARGAAAKYAQLALDLLRFGAPAQCVQGCAQAMQAELSHARSCLELAQIFGGCDRTSAAAVTSDPSSHPDTTSLALAVLRGGCISETVQALLAREALDHCHHAATREALVQRHEAKAQQAQLAFSVLGWLLRHCDEELASTVRSAASSALPAKASTPHLSPADRRLLRFGILSENHRTGLERRVLRDVVSPCIEALIARCSKLPPPPRPFG